MPSSEHRSTRGYIPPPLRGGTMPGGAPGPAPNFRLARVSSTADNDHRTHPCGRRPQRLALADLRAPGVMPAIISARPEDGFGERALIRISVYTVVSKSCHDMTVAHICRELNHGLLRYNYRKPAAQSP